MINAKLLHISINKLKILVFRILEGWLGLLLLIKSIILFSIISTIFLITLIIA